jgi:adenosylhomocysteine nucleosidase
MKKTPPRIGIISALAQEQTGLVEEMTASSTTVHGMRSYQKGSLWGTETVCVLSRLGKVAAAATVASLIGRFKVSHILFTGVAGSADPDIKVGDIVIADQLVQHDMDSRPLFPKFEIPLLDLSHFSASSSLTESLHKAAEKFLKEDFSSEISESERKKFGFNTPEIHRGLIASGDEFINSRSRLAELKQQLPNLMAVEMEGAAVAQVCFEFGIPFSVVRTISDSADENSAFDFTSFTETVASRYAYHIVRNLYLSRQGAC